MCDSLVYNWIIYLSTLRMRTISHFQNGRHDFQNYVTLHNNYQMIFHMLLATVHFLLNKILECVKQSSLVQIFAYAHCEC